MLAPSTSVVVGQPPPLPKSQNCLFFAGARGAKGSAGAQKDEPNTTGIESDVMIRKDRPEG